MIPIPADPDTPERHVEDGMGRGRMPFKDMLEAFDRGEADRTAASHATAPHPKACPI